ncbi:MAG: hypothetical protein ACOCRX_05520 [Candidatus Woesearchaeota archaeon]
MTRDRTIFIILPLLFGFILGGILYIHNNSLILGLKNQDPGYFISVWGEGSGKISGLSSNKINISRNNFKSVFKLSKDYKVLLNPVSEREEYMESVVSQADSCSAIKFNDLSDFEVRESELSEVEFSENVNYFLKLNKETGEFLINRLTIKR